MDSDDIQYHSDDDFKPTPGLPLQVENPKDDLPKIESNATSSETEEMPASGCSIPVMKNKQSRLKPGDLDRLIASANAGRLIDKPSPCPKGGDVYLLPYSRKEDNGKLQIRYTKQIPANEGCHLQFKYLHSREQTPCFNVPENGNVYLVRFNPTSCSCSDKACAHLIAAHLSCNLPVTMDLQRLINNNLSNLEAEEDEDIIGSLSDVEDEALLDLPMELSMLKKSLTLALQHKFREAALEWVNYLCFHKNVVEEKKITKDSSGTKIDLYGAANEYHLLSVIVYIPNHFACILLQPGTSSKEYFLCDDLQERMEWTPAKETSLCYQRNNHPGLFPSFTLDMVKYVTQRFFLQSGPTRTTRHFARISGFLAKKLGAMTSVVKPSSFSLLSL
uniref:SWIM-type domain-containing protein n=1 Tax=Romanomermis culicivorax TaxID=13658 RepID=A0A915HEU7_ROMCU